MIVHMLKERKLDVLALYEIKVKGKAVLGWEDQYVNVS